MSKPVQRFREGQASATIFQREAEGKNGKFVSESVALQQSYLKDGDWVNKNLTVVKKNLYKTIKVLAKCTDDPIQTLNKLTAELQGEYEL